VCSHIIVNPRPASIENSVNELHYVPLRALSQSINQSCIFGVVQVTKSLHNPLEMENNLPGSMIISGNEAWNRNVLNADGRLTETGQISRCPAGCCRWWVRRLGRPGRRRQTVSRTAPADDWSEQSGGNVDQITNRHESLNITGGPSA